MATSSTSVTDEIISGRGAARPQMPADQEQEQELEQPKGRDKWMPLEPANSGWKQ